ncbi:hypothetical protein AMATHDRAFT_1143 [Amanita thiersii Skay4041]|uniref:Carbohydrate-binding module family 50 protein n=1 Tax=Amanita thiersii Skay4041 TaxID=703135 RepID=A0A2A9NZM6_9AGAR|nr:hypothetical protein AMATHDRAFT_1143 [Amanita thiersii Skay4041]
MGRWTQCEEDSSRLPEGMVRVAYDADTMRYTFRDMRSGQLYRSAPGEAFGTLYPVTEQLSRPNAFAPDGPDNHRSHSTAQNPFTTFHDILPAHSITTSPTKAHPSKLPSRLRSNTTSHSRSHSTPIPESPQAGVHAFPSRSKSARIPNNRRQRSPHGHDGYSHDSRNSTSRGTTSPTWVQHSHASPGRTGDKPGLSSISSMLSSISRSLTTIRRRTHDTRSGNDKRDGFRRL